MLRRTALKILASSLVLASRPSAGQGLQPDNPNPQSNLNPSRPPQFPESFVAPGVNWTYEILSDRPPPDDRWGFRAAAWSPDGRLLAVSRNWFGSHFQLWDVDAGKMLWDYVKPYPSQTQSLTFTKDGRYLIVSRALPYEKDYREALSLIDVGTGKVSGHILAPASVPEPRYAESWKLNPAGDRLVVAYAKGRRFLGVYDTSTWELKRTIPHASMPSSFDKSTNLAFDPITGYLLVSSVPPEYNNDEDLHRFLASGNRAGCATWDIETGELIAFQRLGLGFYFDFIPNSHIVIGSVRELNDSTQYTTGLGNPETGWRVVARNALTGETVKTLDGSVSRLEQLSISADGSLIGAACEFGRLQIWDYRTGAIMFSLPGRQWPEKDWLNVLVLAFSPSSNRFAFTLHDRICIGHILKS